MDTLIIKAINGDKDAFTNIILDMQNELYAISRTRLNQEEDINDAIQETILKAFKNIHKLKNPCFFKTWLIRILINNCNSIYKKKQKYHVSFDSYNLENNLYYDNIINVNQNLDFLILIKDLTYEERLILTLYFYNKYTTKQISSLLGINENTIRTKISRAKIKIKNKYKEFDD